MITNILGNTDITTGVYHNPNPNIPLPISATPGAVYLSSIGFQVYDGNYWHHLQGATAQVSLSHNARDVLAWAEKKMLAEEKEKTLLEKYPNLKIAKERYELLKDLLAGEDVGI